MPLWNDDPNIMLVAGHRGGRRVVPENTAPAFQWAMDAGVDMVETDIRQTKDGHLVLMHDERVDRTTDGAGKVRDHTLAEIRRLNAAAHDNWQTAEQVPLLEELLTMAASRPGMLLNLELKEYPWVEGEEMARDTIIKTIDMVEKYGLGDRVIFNSFSAWVLRWIRDNFGQRYRLHGYYPWFVFGDDLNHADEWLDVACLFHVDRVNGENRALPGQICPQSWFDALTGKGIEPWIGAGVKTEEDLCLGFQRGARLVTTDDAVTALAMLREAGLHK